MVSKISGNVIDVNTGKIIGNQVIVGDDGRIVDINGGGGKTDQYLLPGLIDTHVHTVLEPKKDYPVFKENEPESLRMERMRRNVKQSLMSGITTVRDCGHPDALIYQLREEIRTGAEGSRIVSCGPAITTPGGHARQLGIEVRGIKQMAMACEKRLKDGADFIKLINNDPNGFSVDEIKIAVKIAHEHGKKVACHVYQIEAIRRAVEAGVDTIEHFTNVTEEDIQNIINNKIIVSPTYAGAVDAVVHPEANAIGDENIEAEMSGDFSSWVNDLRRGIKLLIKKGVVVATGTDAGFLYTDFATSLREIMALAELGASPLVTIQAATINAAKVVQLEDQLGSLEIGKLADVVVYKENPLENLETVFSPIGVYKVGAMVSFENKVL